MHHTFNTSTDNPTAPPASGRTRRAVARWAIFAAATAATAAITVAVQSSPSGATPPAPAPIQSTTPDDGWEVRYTACIHDTVHSADAMGEWVEWCRERATLQGFVDAAYLSCIRTAAFTPDALEHWVEPCRRRAAERAAIELAFRACLRGTGGTADGLDERGAERCEANSAP